MRALADCYDTFLDGDRLTDAEAIALRNKFKEVALGCADLGQRFRLAFIEANTQYQKLAEICVARGI